MSIDDMAPSISSDSIFQPPVFPPLTRALVLGDLPNDFTRLLLNLPGGLPFRKIGWEMCRTQLNPHLVTALVDKCSGTLECIYIDCNPFCKPRSLGSCKGLIYIEYLTWISVWLDCASITSVDLSKVTKLKEVTFPLCSTIHNISWVTESLKTIKPGRDKYLQQISIHLLLDKRFNLKPNRMYKEGARWQFRGLDAALVHLWKSYRIGTKIVMSREKEKKGAVTYLKDMLPRITMQGGIELAACDPAQSSWNII